MRRKFGILFLIGITVLAGTQEAARQFDGLKSSLNNFTRASLWSGLIVYAQPVSDGTLPTPQIYYLMPTPQRQPAITSPAAQQPVLADNNNGHGAAARPEPRNSHGGEAEAAQAARHPDATLLAAARELEDATKSELALDKLVLDKLPPHVVVPHVVAPHAVAPKPGSSSRARVYEEVARNERPAAAVHKFRQDAEVVAKMFVREFDAAKLIAQTERLTAEQGQLERLKSEVLVEAENVRRRMDLKVVRRPTTRPAPPQQRHERVKVIYPFVETSGVALPEIESIGCEKTRVTPEVASFPAAAPAAAAAAPVAAAAAAAQKALADAAIELELPAASGTSGNSWTLNCDTEPEQK